jgi:hypothetical protein
MAIQGAQKNRRVVAIELRDTVHDGYLTCQIIASKVDICRFHDEINKTVVVVGART